MLAALASLAAAGCAGAPIGTEPGVLDALLRMKSDAEADRCAAQLLEQFFARERRDG
jgi:hypothetical protein